jgi:hypothetical protein
MHITEFEKSEAYLTEEKLGDILITLYPSNEFIHNRVVPNSGLKNRPDYRCDDLMLIVEFDGHYHFTSPKTILADVKKDVVYASMGYKIIRVPYFIQINRWSAGLFFDSNYCDKLKVEDFPHGFITLNSVLPASYCSMGVVLFEKWWGTLCLAEMGEFVTERNIWLQVVHYGRDPAEVFPLSFIENNKEVMKAVIEYGYPT